MERDPFVLTGLMWAWLEQLREPVISTTAVQSLDTNNLNPQTVLDTLDQVSTLCGPKLPLTLAIEPNVNLCYSLFMSSRVCKCLRRRIIMSFV